MTISPVVASAILGMALAGCHSTGPSDGTPVTVSFASPSTLAPFAAQPTGTAPQRAIDASGSNGTLTIDEFQIVVDELKLDGDVDACDGEEGSEDCARFEARPYFLDLPLDAVPVDLATAPVPDGTYLTLKLETRDFESSTGGGDPETNDLAAEVLARFPDWPESASLRVAGSFDPEDGSDPRSFVVYFHGEVKVELTFDPPLAISEVEGVQVVVEVDPLAWFTQDDESVLDLSVYDFATTSEVVDFEAKMAEGFTKIEIDS